MENKRKERRKYKRYLVDKGAFVAENCSSMRGRIFDISKGGLSFTYADSGNRPKEAFELVIYFAGEERSLPIIKCRTVSDFEVPNQNDNNMRRCCVEFKELTRMQFVFLQQFIKERTTYGQA